MPLVLTLTRMVLPEHAPAEHVTLAVRVSCDQVGSRRGEGNISALPGDVWVGAVAVTCGGTGADTLTVLPELRSRKNTSERPLPSPGTMFEAFDSKATQPPSGERLGALLAALPLRPFTDTLARVEPDCGDPERTRQTDHCRPVTARPR